MDEEIEKVRLLITDRRNSYLRSALRWKVSYRILLISAAFLSSMAAVLSGIDSDSGCTQIMASISAAFAAVCTTAIASLEFEKNWRVNKRARHQADLLLLDIEGGERDKEKLVNGLKVIVRERLDESTEDD